MLHERADFAVVPCPRCGQMVVPEAIEVPMASGGATRGPWIAGALSCPCCDEAPAHCPHGTAQR